LLKESVTEYGSDMFQAFTSPEKPLSYSKLAEAVVTPSTANRVSDSTVDPRNFKTLPSGGTDAH
jgi:hypothetical protein